jgi:hypothetical protein
MRRRVLLLDLRLLLPVRRAMVRLVRVTRRLRPSTRLELLALML